MKDFKMKAWERTTIKLMWNPIYTTIQKIDSRIYEDLGCDKDSILNHWDRLDYLISSATSTGHLYLK